MLSSMSGPTGDPQAASHPRAGGATANGAIPPGAPSPTHGAAAAMLARAGAAQPLIREAASDAEAQRTLPPRLVEALREVGVFGMTMARELGGPQLDPLEQFAVVEALAEADGSTGWCAYINSSSGFFTPMLDVDVAREMFPSADVCAGGMPIPVGRAEETEGGYRVTGRWTFGSGVLHCDWMVCGCAMTRGGEVVLDEGGVPAFVAALVPVAQLEVIDTWHALGLRGTGSHDYRVDDVFVARERTFDLFGSPLQVAAPMYRLRTMFLFNQSAVVIGIARHAIAAFGDIVRAKTTPTGPLRDEEHARVALARATAIVGSARSYCLAVLGDTHATLVRGDELSLSQRAAYRLALTHAHRAAIEAVDLLFHSVGTSAAVSVPNVLERCFRDVHTANQHRAVAPETLAVTGGMLLGDAPANPRY
jgi:indole-3-acetate monooxygenase